MVNYTDIDSKENKLIPADIKKLPTAEKNKTNLMSLVNQPFTDRNTVRAISEVIRQIKINKKKYPHKKSDIEKYFGNLLNSFFEFEIGTHELLEKCKQFSSTVKCVNNENKRTANTPAEQLSFKVFTQTKNIKTKEIDTHAYDNDGGIGLA